MYIKIAMVFCILPYIMEEVSRDELKTCWLQNVMLVCISISRHIHMHNIVSKLIPVPNFNSKHLLISALFLLAF